MKTLYGIQYLRALAAIAVVIFHATARAGGSFTVGQAGVDLFFVLSGFLMIAITTPATRPVPFLIDRAKRIVPAYWIATSVFVGGIAVGLFPNGHLDPWHIVSSYLFLPSRIPGTEMIGPILIPGWTLNFEAFFYVLFALSLFAPRRWQLAAVSAALIAAVALGALLHPTGAAPSFYSQPILLEFMAGAWLGAAWKRWGAPPGRWLAIGAAAILYIVAWRLDSEAWRVVTFGIPALLLFVGVLGVEHRDGGLPEWRPLMLAGDASYSIYLWHTMILSVTTKVATLAHLPRPATIAIGVVASVGGGIVAYYVIERPPLRFFRRRRTRLGVPIPAL